MVEEKLKQENNDDKLKQIKALYKKTEDLIKEDISYDNKKNDNEINRKLDIIIDKLNKMDKNNDDKEITKELLTTPEIDASIILNEVKKNLSRKYNLEENKKSDAIFKETIKELFNKYDRETLLNSKLFKLDDNISLKYANFKIKDNMKDNLLQYKLNFSILEVYYFALKEKSEKLLLKVILKQGFKNISLLCFFEKKYVSVFDEEEYINLIANNPTTLFIFISTETKENIHILKNILKINPNFTFNYSSFDLFEDALEVFGIEIIAKNDEILEENIENCYYIEDLNILNEIYEINPKFKLSSSFDLEKAKKVFSTEEISSLNIDKQRNFDYYIDEILKNKEFFRKVFLSNSESYFSPNLPKIINKFNISLDEYLSLNYEDSDKLVEAYKSNLSTFFEYGPEVIVDYVRDNYHAKKVLKKIGDSHEKKE